MNLLRHHEGFTNVDGLCFSWRSWEPEQSLESVPPILLIHGLASSKRIWDIVAPMLAAQRRVVAIDQRGHGESDKPDEGYDIAQIVADDRALTDALGLERPIVVGHSWGGAVALAYASTHPHAVSGLVLVDGGVGDMQSRPGSSWEQIERDLRPPDFAGTPRSAFLNRMRERVDLPWRPEMEDIMLNIVQLHPDDTIGPRLTWERHRQILRSLWDFHPSDHFNAVTCPVLIVLASGSHSSPAATEWNAAKHRGAEAAQVGLTNTASVRIVWFDDTVHDIPLHRPEQLVDEILAVEHGHTDH